MYGSADHTRHYKRKLCTPLAEPTRWCQTEGAVALPGEVCKLLKQGYQVIAMPAIGLHGCCAYPKTLAATVVIRLLPASDDRGALARAVVLGGGMADRKIDEQSVVS